MKKLKGPELKLPELRAPDFLVDLYYDLRDRRLLPLVALGLVAIVAVPFLLSGGSDESAPEGEPGAFSSAQEAPAGSAELTVVKATPGLRDYRRRLRDRSPSDPFHQKYTAPEGAGAASSAPSPATTSSTSSITSSTTSSSESTKGNGSTTTKTTTTTESSPGGSTTTENTTRETHAVVPGPDGKGAGGLTLYSFAVDVKVVRTASTPEGGKEKSEPRTLEKALPPAPLPGPKTQVVTYMGINPTTRQPLLLISDQVTSTFGEGKCLSGASTCQLLEVETGMPVTFVYGPDGARYKITVLGVEPVTTGHS